MEGSAGGTPDCSSVKPASLLWIIAFCFSLTIAAPAAADETRFHRGLKEIELAAGYGFKLDLRRLEGRTDTPFVSLSPRFGRFVNSRLEHLIELQLALFTRPEDEFLGSATYLLRQHLTNGGRLCPFVEVGAGVAGTTLRIPELGGSFQFVLQAGVGVRVAAGRRESLTAGIRFYHLSNAGLRSPNTSLNNGLITVGYSRLY